MAGKGSSGLPNGRVERRFAGRRGSIPRRLAAAVTSAAGWLGPSPLAESGREYGVHFSGHCRAVPVVDPQSYCGCRGIAPVPTTFGVGFDVKLTDDPGSLKEAVEERPLAVVWRAAR